MVRGIRRPELLLLLLLLLLLATNLHGSETTVRVLRRHAHGGVDWWWGSGTVGSASRARVVLAATPAETDTRITDRVALHLVDGHLGSVALNELDETAALTGRNLDVCDLAKALEERAELIFGNVTAKTTNENGGIVGVGELVHWLRSTVETKRRSTHAVHANGTARHATHGSRTGVLVLVLGGSSADAHGSVTAVNALHLGKGTLLVCLIGEADETITARKAADRVRHYLGRLAAGEAVLEDADENVLVDLGAEITNEDGVLGATVVAAAVSKTTTRGPVELEGAVRVGDKSAVELESLGSSVGGFKVDEAVSSITGEFVADHLDVDLVAHAEPDTSDEVLVDPRLELTHPQSGLGLAAGLRTGAGSGSRCTGRGRRELALLGLNGLAHRGLLGLSGGSAGLLGLLTLERVADLLETHFRC